MTIADWLFATMTKLGQAGVDSPRRDALVLLEDTVHKDRAWVLAHPESEIKAVDLSKLNNLVERRCNREPLAYIRGKAWFYGRFFDVNPSVMIPRPESEAFITLIKELKPGKIIEIGTGSGCLAISAQLELPESSVTATDISPEALELAHVNAKTNHANVKFVHGSLLQPLKSDDLENSTLIANLPYVPDGLITSPEIAIEPALALFSGKDGLNHYREFWKEISKLDTKQSHVLCEALESQHHDLIKLAEKAGYKIQKTEQLTQLFVPSHT